MQMKLPYQVEIEINTHCNLSCSYCPNAYKTRKESGEMTLEMYQLILNQLAQYQYRGIVAFEFYNEPLLAKNIELYISLLKTTLPQTTLHLYSNGLKINNLERFRELKKLGVDHFIITHHEEVKNLPFNEIYHQLSDQEKSSVVYRHHSQMTKYNRAGNIPLGKLAQPLNVKCSIPNSILTVSVEGNVLSCFEDFDQSMEFGNAKERNILEIWNDQKFLTFKNNLLIGKRDLYDTCQKCDRLDSPNVQFEKMKLYSETTKHNKHLLDHDEINAISEVLLSGKLFRYQTQNSQCEMAEIECAKFFNTQYAHLVNTGTNALIIALRALEIGPGDEVIVPAYTFVATAIAVLSVGAIPVVCDIDDFLGLDINELPKYVNEKTKAIIAVHMDGRACQIETIALFCKTHHLFLIEDTAQAFGASVKGKKLGTFGDVGCFSFNRDKTITTGEGGLIICNDSTTHKKILMGMDPALQFNPNYQDELKEIAPFIGLSTRVSEITGAILRVQLKKTDRIIEEFTVRKNIWLKKISENKINSIPFVQNEVNECHHVLLLKFSDPLSAATASKRLLHLGINATLLSMRRAHCAWKWEHLLRSNTHFIKNFDPYSYSQKDHSIKKSQYISAFTLLPCILRIEMDMNLTAEETIEIASKAATII